MTVSATLGFVVIGRNEGDRLRRCLASLPPNTGTVVYVDSGSTDDSLAIAARAGATVVSLDTSTKFTAARARNTGFQQLKAIAPDVQFVQFVDGDCEVADGWPEHASRWLEEHERYALASGRRRERFPDRSIYNYLCNLEWDEPAGDALACGGDAMVRAAAIVQVGGYRDSLIAGEEPELCFRLRAAGWRIRRLESEMGLHDASMFRFSQWWKRARRAGYAHAAGAYLHGRSPEAYCVRHCVRSVFWGGAVPVAVLLGWLWIGPVAAWLLIGYPANVIRIRVAQRGTRRGWRWSTFMMLSKFPEFQGIVEFWGDLIRRRDRSLIEYK